MDVTQHSKQTPISNRKIETVNRDAWYDQSISIDQLYTQMYYMQQRLSAAQQIGALPAIAGVQKGIEELQSIIDRRLTEEGDKNDHLRV